MVANVLWWRVGAVGNKASPVVGFLGLETIVLTGQGKAIQYFPLVQDTGRAAVVEDLKEFWKHRQ